MKESVMHRIPAGCWRWYCVLLFLALLALPAAAAPQQRAKLAQEYRNWLDQEVVYIITREERSAFLKLTSDDARDKFIEKFWAIRNPTPDSPTNEYKDEHYRKLAYANARFYEGNREGWRTDRGRIYITLGAPKQIERHYAEGNIRPMEIWFYSSDSPALPPYFYILFYQREAGGNFRIYSPYADGPNKLISTMEGSEETGNKLVALKLLREATNNEVAKISLSLLPDEPVDMTTGRASLESDVMLGTIHDLANNPVVKDQLNRRRELLEGVRSQLIVEGGNLDILTVVLRDASGQPRVHYMLRMHNPGDVTLEKREDGRFYYSVGCRVLVFGENQKLIYTQESTVSGTLDQQQFEQIKTRTMAYEGWLPLAPGKYRLNFLFSDWIQKMGRRAETLVEVAPRPESGMAISGILPFRRMERRDSSTEDIEPFTVGGVKFVPMTPRQLILPMASDLKIAYQLWEPPQKPESLQGQKLEVSYAFGRPAAVGGVKTITESVAREQFDRFGSLVNGKKLRLNELNYGDYLLTVAVGAPGEHNRAFTTAHFRVSDVDPPGEIWEIWDRALPENVRAGVPETERALSLLNQGKDNDARLWLRAALARNPANETARAKLVDIYFADGKFQEVAALADSSPITRDTPVPAVLRMAESRDKLGGVKQAIELLENDMKENGRSGPILLALASYYREIGNTKKADELTKQGQAATGVPEQN
jgi:GWxTD domain-containing protein